MKRKKISDDVSHNSYSNVTGVTGDNDASSAVEKSHDQPKSAVITNDDDKDWLVGCFGFNGPLRQYFSLYRAVSQREGEREEKG